MCHMKPTNKEYASRKEKRADFWIRVLIAIALNVLMALILLLVRIQNAGSTSGDTVSAFINLLLLYLPFVANIGLLFYFGMTRSWIALGMLSVYGVLMLLAVLAGVIFMIYCFVELTSGL